MNNLKLGRLRGILLCLFVSALLALPGCATKSATVEEAMSPPLAGQETKNLVELISVVGSGNEVLIETSDSIKYTAFSLVSPPRVILDLPGVTISEQVEALLNVNNDFITDIVSSTYGEGSDTISRIDIGLKDNTPYVVKVGEGNLLVELLAQGQSPSARASGVEEEVLDEEDESVEVAEVEDAWEEQLDSLDEEVALEEVEDVEVEDYDAESAVPALNIIDVIASEQGDLTVVKIVGDGKIENYNSFALDDPSRIVVDVWNVGSALDTKAVDVDSVLVDRARIGTHPDKTRLVFDSSLDVVPFYNVAKKAGSLVVTFSAVELEALLQEVSDETSFIEPELEVAPEADFAGEFDEEEELEEAIFDEEEFEEVEEAVEEETLAADMEEGTEEDALAVVDEEELFDEVSDEEEYGAVEEEVAEEVFEEEQSIEVQLTKVTDVSFMKFADKGRLSISNSAMPEYRVDESTDGLVVAIDLKDATIPEELMMTLDASELDTPVMSVSSYQATSGPLNVVRLLVRLKEKTAYNVQVDGSGTINVDFLLEFETGETAGVFPDEEVVTSLIDVSKYDGQQKMSIDMVNVHVVDILKLLAEISDLNIIASDSVSGSVTLRLKDVPWGQVFDLVLLTKGLGKITEGNIVRVAPMDDIRDEIEAALAAQKATEKLEDLKTVYLRINYDKALTLAPQIAAVLSDRGTIMVHEPTNTLVVKDVRSAIVDAKSYIKMVDIPIPQVLIEARIVEAETSFARDLGIQWGIDANTSGPKIQTTTFGSSEQFGQIAPWSSIQTFEHVGGGVNMVEKAGDEDNPLLARGGVTNYAVNLPASGIAGPLGGLGFILGKTGANPMILDLRITAGEAQGLVKTISRPRIVTMNNKEAKIQQGESIPFETTSSSGTETAFIDANLSLTVTPQITPDGSVLMAIKASRNSIGSFRSSRGEPSINKKEAFTNVLVKDGETTVMGGIIISDTSNTSAGIPFLMNIPVLGWMFKSKSISDSQKELLIFITPTILKDETAG